MKLWERWLFVTALKSMLMTLGAATLLFSAIDLSAHPWVFKTHNLIQVPLFCMMQLSKMLPLLIGFSALLGSLLCLVHLRVSNTTSALLTSGLSNLKIVRPFLLASLFLAALSFLNYETLYPIASSQVSSMKRLLTHDSPLKKPSVYKIDYPTGEKLICSFIDKKNHSMKDVYLIEKDKLYHARAVKKSLDNQNPSRLEGLFVDSFRISKSGLEKIRSEKSVVFENLVWPKNHWIEPPNPEHMPLSRLVKSVLKKRAVSSHKIALNIRLLSILLAPLGALAAFLFIPNFSRRFSSLTLYSSALIGQILVLMMLGQANLFFSHPDAPSFYFIWLIPLAFIPLIGFSRRFAK